MKRFTNIYAHIADPDNIRDAFLKAARGKRDRKDVKAFSNYSNQNIRKIYEQFEHSVFHVGQYRFFQVLDPKPRSICAAVFSERVLHHAIMNACEPAFEKFAIHDSYACRRKKGTIKALLRSQFFARRYPWFLKLDIQKYFDTIDHGILKRMIERRFKERTVIKLFQRILETYHTLDGKGLPIGNLISQHLANHYLSVFDHWIKEVLKVKGYLRYMDDFLLFARSRTQLKHWLQQLETYLDVNLKLKLKLPIQLNRCAHGFPFLGYRVFPYSILLAPRSKKRFIEKFKLYERYFETGTWSETFLVRHIEPLVAFTRIANAKRFRQHVIEQFGVMS